MVNTPTLGGGGSTGTAASGTGPLAIYTALTAAGASTVQAVGIMGNMIAESSLNPEAVNPAGPSGGIGLVQWESSSYGGVPGYNSLVTGNPAQDIQSQVQFLANTGGFQAASGSTVSQTAGNFAANYERCASCQPGGDQYNNRISLAEEVAGWVASDNWPTSAGQASASATLTAAQLADQQTAVQEEQANCLWGVGFSTGSGSEGLGLAVAPLGLVGAAAAALLGSGTISLGGNVCIIRKSEARAVMGVLISLAGISILFLGLNIGLLAIGKKAAPLIAAIASPASAVADGLGATSIASAVSRSRQSQTAGQGKTTRNLWPASSRRSAQANDQANDQAEEGTKE